MSTPSQAQLWLEKNQENPAIQFLSAWITETLQRPLESIENIEIVPDDPDTPAEIEFIVSFADGSSATQTVQVAD
ncbi:hypothetical protein [Dictyobacter arantiisoli]|uniref:Halobacterial output domain-containing protein n=1 Tax=Dictyobacter arantiisoli TaxID=2014874 RepID=A0A5A5T6K5_9CHLR|nr:hypothetical protein [Dictyobacter arantiisoli]GCF07100.1 hypothetical protein KDI_06640 [Dictyobacter arantiisoli]